MIFKNEEGRFRPLYTRADALGEKTSKDKFIKKCNYDDYIPVASLKSLPQVSDTYRNDMLREIKSELIGRDFSSVQISKLFSLVTNINYNDVDNVISGFLDNYPVFDPTSRMSSGSNYSDLFRHVKSTGFSSSRMNLRNIKYYANTMFLGELIDLNSSEYEIKPIFSLMTKRENYNYLKLCWLLDEEPVASALEFWVRSDFDIKDSSYKNLRPRYRKDLKLSLIEKGIEIKEFDDLKIFKEIKLPNFKTPSKKREWASEVALEAFKGFSVERDLRYNHDIILQQ